MTSAWLSWLIATFFFSYQSALRIFPGTISTEIMNKFSIDPSVFGQISGVYYITYAISHIPIGLMLDRFGPKKVISFCAILLVIGILPSIYSQSWVALYIGRILIASGSSAGVLGVFKVLRIHFTLNKFALLFGISVTANYLGAVFAGHPIKLLLQTVGMENTMLFMCFIGVCTSIIALLIIPEIEKNKEESKCSVLKNLQNIFTHKEWIFISFLGGLMIGPLEGFADAWSVKFLSVYYPLMSGEKAAFISSMIFLGFAISAPFIGYIIQKVNTQMYYGFIFLLGVFMFCCFSSLLLFKLNQFLLAFIIFSIGTCSNYQTLVIIKSTTLVSEKNSMIVSACSNMIIMVFGYFFHTVISMILNNANDHFSEDIFFKSLSIIPASIFVAILGFSILHLRSKKSKT